MVCFRAAIILLTPVLAFSAATAGPARVIVAAADPVPRQSAITPIAAAPVTAKTKFLQSDEKKTRAGADVYYVAEALDKLKLATAKQQAAATQRYELENERLEAATEQATLPTDRSLLETTVEMTEENKLEELNSFKAMYNMYYTMKAAFGAAPTAPSCEFLTCGEHGRCVSDGVSASCQCKPCFAGNGFLCKPSTCSPTARATAQPMGLHLKTIPAMEDIAVSVFHQNHLVAAFRDKKQDNRGFLLIGEAGEADIKWSQLQPFSKNFKAYNPQIIVMPTGRIVVQFRDAHKDGTGYLMGGRIDEKDSKKAIMLDPVAFVKGQNEATALVPLATSRVVCLYSHPKGPTNDAYGGAIFLQVVKGGSISVIGKYRFADHLVTQVAAVALRPTSFVVAYRDPPLADEPSDAYSRELSAVWMSMQDNELVVDPHPIVIEPETKDMGVRDVSLVSENLFAYSYQSKSTRKTKMAIVRVDPDTHRMKVTEESKELADGDTGFVKSISTPFQSLAPHTLTYIQHPRKNSVAETCRISPSGKISDCQELPWSNSEVADVTGARLGDGRLVFVFSDIKKDPYYQMLGAPGS
jgi:hypothetical protein